MADVMTDEDLRSGPIPAAFEDAETGLGAAFDDPDDEPGDPEPAAKADAPAEALGAADFRAELDVLRQELAEERKQNRELLLKALGGQKADTPKREAKAKPTPEQVLDGIATGGTDYLRDLINEAAEEMGFVRRDQLNDELGQFGQRLVQTQAKDTEIFEEFPELKTRDKGFISETRALVEKAREMGPEGQIMYLAAAAVKAKRNAGKAGRPNPRAYEGGRSSGAPAGRQAAPQYTPQMARTLKELGIK